jgi:hypothetical protein
MINSYQINNIYKYFIRAKDFITVKIAKKSFKNAQNFPGNAIALILLILFDALQGILSICKNFI